jgi:hypothetical protein
VTAYNPSQWTELFVASAGASAALTGLVFVAVSINIDRILRLAGVPERALVTLLLLLGVLVVSLVALVPELSRTALGLLLLGQALFSGPSPSRASAIAASPKSTAATGSPAASSRSPSALCPSW